MRAVSESIEQMNEQAALFIDGIVGELESHHKRMEDQIKNKKENLQKYENLLNELKNAKQVLQEADTASIFLQWWNKNTNKRVVCYGTFWGWDVRIR